MGKAQEDAVLVPYKITLLSNSKQHHKNRGLVLVPYKITLLSNPEGRIDEKNVSFSTL